MPVGDRASWSQEPFGGEVVDGRLYGRGATDMKGGLAAAMWATKVALEEGLRPRGDVVFHVVSDEEVVGNGTREIVERAPAADVTISLEPTELRLCAAEGGLVHFRIEVEGVEAHASTRYLAVHAGGKGRRRRERDREDAEDHGRAAGARAAVGGRRSRIRSCRPGSTRCCRGSSSAGPGGGADGRLNLFSNAGTTPNYCSVEYNMWWYPDEAYDDVQGRGRGGRRGRRAAPTRGWPSTRRGSPGSSAASTSRRSTCRSTTRRWARWPAACASVGLDPTPVGLRGRDRPRLVRRAQAAGDHLRARARSRSATSPTSTSTPSSSCLASQVYAQMLVEWCG